MASTSKPDTTRIDPERPRNTPFDHASGYSGQEYDADAERALAALDPGGVVDPAADRAPANNPDGTDIPGENGRRAFFDPATGAVHGSGAGAGGGNPGEDFDSDSATGDGDPITGASSEVPRD